jgi:outer membrane protein assembly factor BamB
MRFFIIGGKRRRLPAILGESCRAAGVGLPRLYGWRSFAQPRAEVLGTRGRPVFNSCVPLGGPLMIRISLAFLGLLLAPLVLADDWPQWLGPDRNGCSNETIKPWTGPPATVWKVPVGEGHSSPIVAAGKVFLHAKVKDEEKEQVEAFDAATGKPLWKETYERSRFQNQFGNGPRATPLFHDGRLYTLGVTGVLSCWDAATGRRHWQHDLLAKFGGKNLFFGISTTPLVHEELLLVMVGAPGASIVAFDRKSGDVRWQAGDDPASYSSPILLQDRLAIVLTAKGVRCLEAASGKERWFWPFVDLLNESSSTPVRAGGRLLVSSVTAGTLCLQNMGFGAGFGTRPAQAWKDGKLCCYFATPVVQGEHVYIVTGSLPPLAQANLHCVELKTGKVLWTRHKVGTYHATLLKTKDTMLMLEEAGELVLFAPDPAGYRELSRATICDNTWAHPALAGGRLYVRDANALLCVELK